MAKKAPAKARKKTLSKTAAKVKAELVTDQDYLPALLGLLKKAKSKIDILSFSFAIGGRRTRAPNGAPFEIAQAIVALKKAKPKIKVRLYIEGLRETADRNQVTAAYLEKAGVQIVYGSTHAKGFCVDDRFVLFGSTNLTNQSIMKNNEANLLIDSKPVAKGFEAYFEHLWNGGGHGGIKLRAPLLPDGEFKDALITMIDSAKKRFEFSIYFFDQSDIRDALIRAHKRGVHVTGFVHQHYSFALDYIRRNFRTVKALKVAGITDLHYSQPHTFSHSKYAVRDRQELMLGTGNWLNEDVEVHPQLYIQLKDPALAKALAKHVQSEIKSRSAERLWSTPRA